MATGTLPFRGGSSAEIFKAILDGTPRRSCGSIPTCRRICERIIHKALEKDRNLRYQNAADLRTDLARLKRDVDSGHSVASASPAASSAAAPAAAPAPSHSRKYDSIAGVAAGSVVLAAAGGLYFLRGKSQTQQPQLHCRAAVRERIGRSQQRIPERWPDRQLDQRAVAAAKP